MKQGYLMAFIVVLLLTGGNRLSAQPNSIYFLKGVPQTKDLNPARPGIEKGFYLSMPLFSRLDFSVNTNNWSYNDLIHRGRGAMKDSLVWDFKNYLSSLDKNNFVNESMALTLLEAGWKRGTYFYGFSWSERQVAEPFFTRNVVDLLYYGNASYLGSTYHTGYLGVGAQHYREFAFTIAKEVSKKLRVGITGKLLFGLAGIKTSGLNVVAGMPQSGNQIDIGANGNVFISAPVDVQILNDKGYKMVSRDYFSMNSYLSNFGNPGFAVDLGFATKVNKEFEFSMSLIDLGFISWSRDVTTLAENGHFIFRGVNLNTVTPTNNPPTSSDAMGLFLALSDSLRGAFLPMKSTNGFSTLLPVKLYVAGEYKVGDDVALGGLARIRMFNNMLHTSLTASINTKLTSRLSFTASYSMMESTYDNLGLAAAWRAGAIQFYAASDNVVSFARLSSARNMNLRFGINLLFQDGEKRPRGLYNGRRRSK
jgi:hypothetical protein